MVHASVTAFSRFGQCHEVVDRVVVDVTDRRGDAEKSIRNTEQMLQNHRNRSETISERAKPQKSILNHEIIPSPPPEKTRAALKKKMEHGPPVDHDNMMFYSLFTDFLTSSTDVDPYYPLSKGITTLFPTEKKQPLRAI